MVRLDPVNPECVHCEVIGDRTGTRYSLYLHRPQLDSAIREYLNAMPIDDLARVLPSRLVGPARRRYAMSVVNGSGQA